ncbi:MAG: NTP transferase domain-containing protein [Chitinivibrionia bacterium]|nr:NTP transferase domain-containing protein [Chitinivibrionia bacterium]
MKAIIPAAGIGTRLRPHTYSVPKALLFVAGKPILAHILDDVLALGVSGIALIVGYKGDLLETYVRDTYPGIPVDFIYQEQRLGIGHAVSLTGDVAGGAEPLLIILGDTIIKTDLGRVVGSRTNILGVKEVEDPRRFGVCELRGGRIVRLVEKPDIPPSNLALVGLYYILEPALLFECLREEIERDIKTRGEYQITDALQMMIDRGSEFRPHIIEQWFDCGKPDALLQTNRHLLESVARAPEREGSILIPPVSIDPSADIIGSIVGPYVSIGAGSAVRNSIIRDSVLGEQVSVEHSLLERSLIGSRAVVKGHFTALNVGDSSEIYID